MYDDDLVAICPLCGRHVDELGAEATFINHPSGAYAVAHRGCLEERV